MRRRSAADRISTGRPCARSTAALRSRIAQLRARPRRPSGRRAGRARDQRPARPRARPTAGSRRSSAGSSARSRASRPRPARGTARAGSGRGCCRSWRRRRRVDLVALDQQHLGPAARQIVGDGGAGETAADDQDVGAHQALQPRFRFAGAPPRNLSCPAARGNREPSGHGTSSSAAATRSRSHPSPRTARRSTSPAWRRFLDWQLAEGVPGIIILGTTGEFLTITDEERQRIRRGDRQACRQAHPGHGRHHERLHAERRALQPRGARSWVPTG